MVQLICMAAAMALALALAATLPARSAHAAPLADGTVADGPTTDTYTVQIGDTLYGIAQRTGVDLDALMTLNNLSDPDTIFVGTVLRLPSPAPAGPGGETARPGQTNPAPPASASQAPALHAQAFQPQVPEAPMPAPVGSTTARTPVAYTVQPGDTLGTIAQRFGTTPGAFVDGNGFPPPTHLTPGQTLMLVGDPSVTLSASARGSASATVPMQMAAMNPMALASPQFTGAAPATSIARPGAILANPTTGAPVASRALAAGPGAALNDIPTGAVPSVPAKLDVAPALRTSTHPQALAVARTARQFAGAPYVYGGDSPAGFDCSGFIQFMQQQAGREVPRDLLGMYLSGIHPTGPLEPGDLVFFQNTYMPGLSHAGIYLGDGQFIHAISEGSGVGISSLDEPYYAERWYGATRPQ